MICYYYDYYYLFAHLAQLVQSAHELAQMAQWLLVCLYYYYTHSACSITAQSALGFYELAQSAQELAHIAQE